MTIFKNPVFRPIGDMGLLIRVGDSIDRETNSCVRRLVRRLESAPRPGLIEVIPAYNTVLINFDPLRSPMDSWIEFVESLDYRNPTEKIEYDIGRIVEIPVLYGGEFGQDIEFVAKINNVSVHDVIRIHSSEEYFVYMLGFTPGFAYLGGLSPKIHAPRLDSPREVVPAGSIGIANDQTGIYPISSAGGWRLIGRTPLKLFRPQDKSPFVYEAGDSIRFRSISPEEYESLTEFHD